MKTLRVYFNNGPLTLTLPVGVRKIGVEKDSVKLCLFLKAPNRTPSVSGWSIREIHMPHAVYGMLLENMRKANISLREADIRVEISESGTEIRLFVSSGDPSSFRQVDRSIAVIQTTQTLFFPFDKNANPNAPYAHSECKHW